MDAWLHEIALWWLTFGFALLIAEMFTGTLLFLFMGGATFLVALITFLFDPASWVQWLIYGVALIAAVVFWRRVRPNPGDKLEQRAHAEGLNNRLAAYVGRELVLEEAIVNGQGRVRLDDSYWSVEGQDALVGARVRVTAIRGIVLMVESIE
jgi:hypothetical protein